MNMVSLNQPFQPPSKVGPKVDKSRVSATFSEVLYTPLEAFEHLFFAVFGMSSVKDVQKSGSRPQWTEYLFKIMFMVYMSVSVVVLINLLIAMMSDTYQRIQAQSDIEWKYGLAKLIRNMHRTTTTPSPLNLMTSWFMYLLQLCKQKVAQRKRPSLVQMMGLQRQRMSARTKMGAKWLQKVKKGQVAPKVGERAEKYRKPPESDSTGLSVVHLSPLGSQLSFSNSLTRIENVTDWDSIAKKYRALMGEATETSQQSADDEEEAANTLAESNNNIT
ncbi:hypothetical protein B7P43_G07234 [Cryptotermes secundus]|uniref:Ion transport domain-containing protein n=4 Tax=Cryptotermes secundus TaxID=105785 RepID=A0A2J7RC49_9NEOP|nr:hypothetical protein B7P43_G07234 [Cryptotermes secundus]